MGGEQEPKHAMRNVFTIFISLVTTLSPSRYKSVAGFRHRSELHKVRMSGDSLLVTGLTGWTGAGMDDHNRCSLGPFRPPADVCSCRGFGLSRSDAAAVKDVEEAKAPRDPVGASPRDVDGRTRSRSSCLARWKCSSHSRLVLLMPLRMSSSATSFCRMSSVSSTSISADSSSS